MKLAAGIIGGVVLAGTTWLVVIAVRLDRLIDSYGAVKML